MNARSGISICAAKSLQALEHRFWEGRAPSRRACKRAREPADEFEARLPNRPDVMRWRIGDDVDTKNPPIENVASGAIALTQPDCVRFANTIGGSRSATRRPYSPFQKMTDSIKTAHHSRMFSSSRQSANKIGSTSWPPHSTSTMPRSKR